jgi:ABC-type transport system involved in multi-copper enzyme maturation permease subunit
VLDPTSVGLVEQAKFAGVVLLLALALLLIADRSMRRVVLGQMARPARRARPSWVARLVALLPGPSLDGNPVLWREWHRKKPTRWTGRLWVAYTVVSTLASLLVIILFYIQPTDYETRVLAQQINAWEVAIGLLLLGISAATSLAEERDRGSLDVIMATPLSTGTILWGKWWGTFAIALRLAVFPLWISGALAMVSGQWSELVVMIVLIAAYSVTMTSLGLALATWIPRLGRAVGTTVLGYSLITWTWPLVSMVTGSRSAGRIPSESWERFLVLVSPYDGILFATERVGDVRPNLLLGEASGFPVLLGSIGAAYAALALLLIIATWRSFDFCLGRVRSHPPHPGRSSPRPSKDGLVVDRGQIGGCVGTSPIARAPR